MKTWSRMVGVVLGLAVAAGSAAALENGKQCARAPEKAAKEKGAAQGARTPISGEPWTPMGAQDKVVYGTDDRIDVYQETDPLRRELAGAVCGLVNTASLTPLSVNRWELSLRDYTVDGYPPCASEPFATQPVAAWCTGFLVGEDLIATAGHCFSDGEQPDVRFIFGFEMTDATTPVSVLEASQVYAAVEVVGWALSGELDYCIVRVDRPVTAPGAQPLQIRREGTVPLDTPIGVIGHPAGLPKKIAFGPTTEVADNAATGYFTTNLDTYGGNSGSPVFNAATGVVEGILVRGATDYVLQGSCFISNVLPDSDAGEEVSKSTTFAQFVPEYIAGLGKITLDKEAYKPTDIVQITLEDVLDAPSATVSVTGAMDTKSVALTAVKAVATQFTGAVQLYTAGKADPSDMLFVLDGGEMTVRYSDADDGSGSPAVVEKTVPIDGTAPVIAGASAIFVGATSAVVTVDANEPVTATVRYGTDCAALTQTAQSAGAAATNPSVTLGGLSQETAYYFSVEVADAAGNAAAADNGGACFTFTTNSLNDACADAWSLPLDAPVSGSNAGAATDYDAGDGSGADVWFAFTAPATATYAFSTCGSALDSVLHVFSGNCGGLVPLTSNDDWCGYQSLARALLTAGATYHIRVAGHDGETGDYTLTASESTPLPNDPCGSAVALTTGVSYEGDSSGAGTDYDTDGMDGADVWFSFTPATAGTYDISLCGSSFDTTLMVFLGGCADPVGIAFNDDYCGLQSQVRKTLQAGVTCLIRVADYRNAGGQYTIRVAAADTSADPCPDDPVTDSGFETGSPNLGWMEYSQSFGSPLCDASCNDNFTAYEGDWFVWFGGTDVAEQGWVVQYVPLPAAEFATASFQVRIPTAGTTGHMAFLMDGDELFRVTEADAARYAEWTLVEVDISAYADGGVHELVFESAVEAPETDVLTIFVDQVCIESGAVTVPNVVGQAQAAAQAAITSAGLTVGTVTEVYSETAPAGSVISQSPVSGATVAPGSAVSLTVSKGADPAVVDTAHTALRDAFNQADIDGSGGLTYEEARTAFPGLSQAVFNALDTNGDGVLDKTELGVEDSGCGCGCSKSDLTPEGLKQRLGDFFLGGLALMLLAGLGRRTGF